MFMGSCFILPLQNRRFSAICSTSIKTAELKQKLIPCPQGFSIVAPSIILLDIANFLQIWSKFAGYEPELAECN